MPATSREDHPLHDHRHVHLPVVEAVAKAVGHGPLGEQRCPAAAARARGSPPAPRRSGTCPAGRRTRPSAGLRPSHSIGPRRRHARRAGRARRRPPPPPLGDGDPLHGPADLRAARADRVPVVRVQLRQPIELSSIDGTSAMARRKASVVTQNPAGTRMPPIRESSPRFAPLPPTIATCDRSMSSKPNTSLPKGQPHLHPGQTASMPNAASLRYRRQRDVRGKPHAPGPVDAARRRPHDDADGPLPRVARGRARAGVRGLRGRCGDGPSMSPARSGSRSGTTSASDRRTTARPCPGRAADARRDAGSPAPPSTTPSTRSRCRAANRTTSRWSAARRPATRST